MFLMSQNYILKYLSNILKVKVFMSKKRTSTVEIGRRGEDLALEYLLKLGYTLLHRNWRSKYRGFGEIDLIMTNGSGVVIVFIEVKYRRKHGCFGDASTAIDENKKNMLYKTGQQYLIENAKSLDSECLFSAVLIDESAFSRSISVIENIFI